MQKWSRYSVHYVNSPTSMANMLLNIRMGLSSISVWYIFLCFLSVLNLKGPPSTEWEGRSTTITHPVSALSQDNKNSTCNRVPSTRIWDESHSTTQSVDRLKLPIFPYDFYNKGHVTVLSPMWTQIAPNRCDTISIANKGFIQYIALFKLTC